MSTLDYQELTRRLREQAEERARVRTWLEFVVCLVVFAFALIVCDAAAQSIGRCIGGN